MPITHPDKVELFRKHYRGILPESDLVCLSKLIETGKIELVQDRRTRQLSLIPKPEVEHFLEVVLEAACE